MAKIKGNDLILFIQKNDKYKAYAYSTTCEIDIQADTIEVGSPDTGQWVKKKKRKKNWRLSSGYLISEGGDTSELFKTLIDNNSVMITLGSVRPHADVMDANDYVTDGRLTIQGEGMLTRMTITGRKGDFVTMSIEVEGSGGLAVLWEPTITIEPLRGSDEGIAGEKRILITSNINYEILSDSSWLTVDKEEGSTGVTEVVVNYAVNDGEERVGKVTAIGKYPYQTTIAVFTFTQRVHPSKFLIIKPSSLKINGNGDKQTINISGYRAWRLINKPEWVTVSPSYGGSILGEYVETDVVIKAEPNPESVRRGQLEFITYDAYLSKIVEIEQERLEYVTVDPVALTFPALGGSETVILDSSESWSVLAKPEWITVTPDNGGGPKQITVDAAVNTGEPRNGTVTFDSSSSPGEVKATLTVKQEGEVPPLVIEPNTIHGIPSSGGSYDVTIKATGNWTCSYNPTWARPDNGSGAAGETTIKLDIDANTGNERGDYLEFELDDTGYVVELDVLQNAASPISGISLEPPFPSELLGNAYSGGEYEVVSENDWSASFAESIEMNPTTGGAGRTYVDFQVPANTDKPRVVALELVDEITGERYLFGCIQQAVTGASKEIVPSTEGFTNVPKAGGLRSTYIASLKDWIYDADLSVNANWLTVIQKSGVEGITEVSIMVSQNQTGLERLGEIWFATADGTDYSRIGVHQLG